MLHNTLVIYLVQFTIFITQILAISEILVAINPGGPEHVDINGIKYQADPSRQGVASDYGKRYIIGRVEPDDQILYQTERYSVGDFEYALDLTNARDGDYVLVLKFSEVYFEGPNQKVFNVAVNEHTVIHDLDIFAVVGKAIAHDEIIPFTIKNKQLTISGETSDFDNIFRLKFYQGSHDNPKINAFYIMKGRPEHVPAMPELEKPEDEFLPKQEEMIDDEPGVRERFASGPQMSDPYAQQEASQMFIPVLVALACFFPILFCLCRL